LGEIFKKSTLSLMINEGEMEAKFTSERKARTNFTPKVD
jgi:hypothetical protein